MVKRFVLVFAFITSSYSAVAQCAMCKAVVENGDEGMAEGVNDGIVYLMVFPYVLVFLLAIALYKYRKKIKAN